MIRLLVSLVVACLFLSCSGNGEKAKEVAAPPAKTMQKELSREEIEQARLDSIREEALLADTVSVTHILIDKESFTLFVRGNGETIMSAPVCLGKGIGQKTRKGDHKTPEGEYKIISIENSSSWTHDFHDGIGERKGAYGPWFFRLNTPQSSHIGIHGSCFPETVGQRDSDGCVRLRNEDLEELKKFVSVGMKVIINPDK